MKNILLSTAICLVASVSFAKQTSNTYKVTVINLTKGQPITPPVVAVHRPYHQPVLLGEKASQGLAELAKDGFTDQLVTELSSNKAVVRTMVGSGVILPGQRSEIIIEANNPNFKISVIAMLARTNDAIAVAQNISLRRHRTLQSAVVYDAGAEANSESCDHIPAPPCGSVDVSPETAGEGFIRPHDGLNFVGDLVSTRDQFASKVALVIVERI